MLYSYCDVSTKMGFTVIHSWVDWYHIDGRVTVMLSDIIQYRCGYAESPICQWKMKKLNAHPSLYQIKKTFKYGK